MRVLVMGVTGMLGHKVYQTFAATKHQVYGTLRGSIRDFEKYALFDPKGIIEGVDARIPQTVEKAFLIARPKVVINCLGLIKPRSKDPALTIEINSLFPHRLAELCALSGARLLHLSTDCVFSGRKPPTVGCRTWKRAQSARTPPAISSQSIGSSSCGRFLWRTSPPW